MMPPTDDETHTKKESLKDVESLQESEDPSLTEKQQDSVESEDFGEVENHDAKSGVMSLNPQDMQVLEALEEDFSNAANESEIGLKAQVMWARRSALFIVLFVAVYLVIGVAFFSSQSPEWGFSDTCLFAVYTVTSAGLGHLETPDTVAYQTFQIFYILIGIAAFALCLAQTFQYFSLTADLATKAADKAELTRQGLEKLEQETPRTVATQHAKEVLEHKRRGFLPCFEGCAFNYGKAMAFFEETTVGRVLSSFIPLLLIVLVGALTIGQLEGWSFLTSVYFAVVALTTVGYGDYYPKTTAGIWCTIVWLPCTLIFTSLYMGAIANAYFSVARKGIAKIEERLRCKAIKSVIESSQTDPSELYNSVMVEAVSKEMGLISSEAKDTEAGESDLDKDVLTKAPAPYPLPSNSFNSHFGTFGDVIKAVKDATLVEESEVIEKRSGKVPSYRTGQLKLLSLKYSMDTPDEVCERPCFALRTLVKERLAQIIAKEIAGGQSRVLSANQDSSLLINLANSKESAEKWFIPRRARKVFSIVAFEAVFLIGERALLKEGKKAFFDLSPKTFHRIFSPLVVAMGDAETLESWLASTELLTEQELCDEDLCKEHAKMTVAEAMVKMPVNPGSAFNPE